jgi:phosphoenolpyruvate carboxylase
MGIPTAILPYLDPLNHMQIELLKRYRAAMPMKTSSPGSI